MVPERVNTFLTVTLKNTGGEIGFVIEVLGLSSDWIYLKNHIGCVCVYIYIFKKISPQYLCFVLCDSSVN